MQDPADEAFQQAAATFAACVDAGEEARVERATLFHHMAVLNILARGHSLEVWYDKDFILRWYAAHAPWVGTWWGYQRRAGDILAPYLHG